MSAGAKKTARGKEGETPWIAKGTKKIRTPTVITGGYSFEGKEKKNTRKLSFRVLYTKKTEVDSRKKGHGN